MLRVQLCDDLRSVLSEGVCDPFQLMGRLTLIQPHMGQLQAKGGHKRATRARPHAYGGNLPARARHKTAAQLDAGLGVCAMCTDGVCDSQEHFFECPGTCHSSVVRAFQALRHEFMVSALQLVSMAGLPIRRASSAKPRSRLPPSPRVVHTQGDGDVSDGDVVRVAGGVSGVKAETRTLKELDRMARKGKARRMFEELVKVEAALRGRGERELDRWRSVLGTDPRVRLLYSMEASVRLREKRRSMARRRAIKAKKAEEKRVAAGLPPTRPARYMAEMSSDSESDEDRSGIGRKGDHDPARPRWTRVHPAGVPSGCSLYTSFLQYVWLHKPDVLLDCDFWPAVQLEAQSFTDHD